MNSSSIMKKVLPVILTIVLILAITIVAGAVKTGSESYPQISNADSDYIKITDNLSISRGEMYEELKNGIGLSSIITMTNINLMKTTKNADGKSFFEAVTDEEIEEAIKKDTYGEDADLDALTEEEKEEKVKEFKDSMYSGYGYKTDLDIENHYRLTISMKAYAKTILEKEVDDKDNDLYIKDETLEDKYEDEYSKSYYAIVIPFANAEQAKLALQQLGVGITSGKWAHQTLEEVQKGSGIFETKTGSLLNTSEVMETFVKLYDIVYGYKGEGFVQGDYEINNGAVKVLSGDYAIVEVSEQINSLSKIAEKVKEILSATEVNKEAAIAELAKTKAVIEEINGMLVFVDGLKSVNANIDDLNKALEGDAEASDPLKAIDTLISTLQKFDTKKYIFNTESEDNKIFKAYSALKNYDSVLPSQFKNNYNAYVPFTNGDLNATINESAASQSFYSANPYSGTNVYYFLLKIKEVDVKSFESVKGEIKAKIIEEKLTDAYVAEKMAELRQEKGFKVFDTQLENLYIKQVANYENVKYKKSKKDSKSNLIVSTEGFEVTVDDLFKYMDSTSGVATALSELSYRRLVNDSKYNKYYDAQTGKWVGEEGEELKQTIIDSIQNQRLYFLAGAYTSYGYDPSTMTWQEFMQNVNGAKDETDLAFLNLYSKVAGEYLQEAFKFIETDGEELEIKLKATLEEAKNSELWALISKRMEETLAKKFSVSGVHMLVSVYDTVNAANDSKGTPLAPAKWTQEQKDLAVELIKEVQAYVNCVEGTYEEKLNSVVNAFNAAPYAVKADGKYVPVVDADGNQYKYQLEACECKIDLAKYKSAGLSLKVENLGSFTEGKMVESFNDAAKSIWDKDMADKEYSRITVYGDAIETVYGYHLYVNLSSTPISEYEAKVNETETVKQVLPTLYEIRLNALISALEAASSEVSEENKEAFDKLLKETKELLSAEASQAIKDYSSTVVSQITGSYFTSIVQQKDLLGLLKNTNINSPSGLTYEDFVKIYEINKDTVYKNTLKSLENGDEEAFNGNK